MPSVGVAPEIPVNGVSSAVACRGMTRRLESQVEFTLESSLLHTMTGSVHSGPESGMKSLFSSYDDDPHESSQDAMIDLRVSRTARLPSGSQIFDASSTADHPTSLSSQPPPPCVLVCTSPAQLSSSPAPPGLDRLNRLAWHAWVSQLRHISRRVPQRRSCSPP